MKPLSPRRAATVSLLALCGLQLTCGSARTGQTTHTQPALAQPSASPIAPPHHAAPLVPAPLLPAPQPSSVPPPTPASPTSLSLTQYDVLRSLESQGLSLGALLFGTPEARTAQQLSQILAYRDIVLEVSRALTAARARDTRLGEGMAFGHRAFPIWWLGSPAFRYELVGIVNRVDRHVFEPRHCGELRFIYRLAYQAEVEQVAVASRLPMTVNVVAWLPGAECNTLLSRLSELTADKATALTQPGKVLAPDLLSRLPLKSVEINLQSARWPSTVRPNMAGHAEYVMRVFEPAAAASLAASGAPALRLIPAALENTPDVARLEQQPALRRELLSWLSEPAQLQQIDRGTVVVPEKFLSQVALSVAPHGFARLSNRPFSQLYSDRELQQLPLERYRTFRSSRELLRRLDGLSCPGCHQSRSMAGFHLLGEDPPQRIADTLSEPLSPHALDEQRRRAKYWAALSQGQTPDEFRAPAERPQRIGGYGDTCQLQNPDWSCAAGLQCTAVSEPSWGQCLPKVPSAGSACETGTMDDHRDPHRDFLKLTAPQPCGPNAVCERSGVGFPGGMCAKACAGLQTGERCGSIAVLDGFNTCLARHEPFEQCIQGHARPAALRACSATEPCRDDYVCARTASGAGACIPPYFLFQLRVDGHVLPKSAKP